MTRKHCKQYERDDFDGIFPSVSSDDLQTLSKLVAKLLFFFDDKQDLNRLVSKNFEMIGEQTCLQCKIEFVTGIKAC